MILTICYLQACAANCRSHVLSDCCSLMWSLDGQERTCVLRPSSLVGSSIICRKTGIFFAIATSSDVERLATLASAIPAEPDEGHADIEVRGSQTGYFTSARYGMWLRPCGRVVGTWSPPPSLGNSGRRSGQESIMRGFLDVLGSWSETFVNAAVLLQRISMWIPWA